VASNDKNIYKKSFFNHYCTYSDWKKANNCTPTSYLWIHYKISRIYWMRFYQNNHIDDKCRTHQHHFTQLFVTNVKFPLSQAPKSIVLAFSCYPLINDLTSTYTTKHICKSIYKRNLTCKFVDII
jgi:hypothetical protein